MNEEDARLLALEAGHVRGHTLKVLLIDDAPAEPPLEELRAAVARGLTELPRWRDRLTPSPGAATGLCWSEDPDFDIRRHVRLAPAPGPMGSVELRRFLADTMAEPLVRSRPLWTLDLIPRVADGRWALAWKVHHCLADGMAIMRAGARLLWAGYRPRPPAIDSRPRAHPSPPAQLAAGVRLVRVLGYRGLVLREFRRVWGLSPLAGEVGPDRAVAFTDCGLGELRAIGRAAGEGVTVNDVLVSAVAGAIRRWLLAHRLPISRMKALIPVNMDLQSGSRASSGNRDSFLLVELPLAEVDPMARLQRVSSSTRLRKNRHDARAIYALRRSLGHAPQPIRHSLQHVVHGPHEYSLNISNVPGPSGPIAVLGRRVHALYSLAEISPHHALRVAAISLDGRLYVGLCADRQIVVDLDSIAEGIRQSVDELAARARDVWTPGGDTPKRQ